MLTPQKFLIATVVLATVLARAQDEQSALPAASASARYWTAPRIQQEPPRDETSHVLFVAATNAKPLSITNEFLTVSVQPDGSGLTITDRFSGKAFITGGNFKANGGRAAVLVATDQKFGTGHCIQISHPDGADMVFLYPKVPFALIRSSIRNRAARPAT